MHIQKHKICEKKTRALLLTDRLGVFFGNALATFLLSYWALLSRVGVVGISSKLKSDTIGAATRNQLGISINKNFADLWGITPGNSTMKALELV